MWKFSRFDWIVGGTLIGLVLILAVTGVIVFRSSSNAPMSLATTSHNATSTTTAQTPSLTTTPTTIPPTTTVPAPTTTTSTVPTVPTPGTAPPTIVAPAAVAGQVTAVGDSIMIDIQPYLQTDIPGVSVDGLVSRQFETGISVVQQDRANGTLGKVLVVELGTNGSVTSADFDAMMQAAAGVTRVVFVNTCVPRSWEAADNATLAAGVARYPGVAVLADWYSEASPHPEWFTADQVHLNPAGAQAMAALITQYV